MQAPQCSLHCRRRWYREKKKEKKRNAGVLRESNFLPQYANGFHTSSVNRLFLLPSRDTGVSLLPNAGAALGVQEGVPDVATLGFWTFDLAACTVGRL